jgi:hypothetical protein
VGSKSVETDPECAGLLPWRALQVQWTDGTPENVNPWEVEVCGEAYFSCLREKTQTAGEDDDAESETKAQTLPLKKARR